MRNRARPLNLPVLVPVSNSFSRIGSELPVSSAELITDSMFKKFTSLPFLSKTRETFPRDRLADTQATTCSIRTSDIKNMNDFSSETRFYRG